MELINKKYSIRTPDAITVHRDMTMKLIEVNKLIEKLLDSVNPTSAAHEHDNERFHSPYQKRLVPLIPEESQYGIWGYSREASAPRLAQKRFESKVAKNSLPPTHSLESNHNISPDQRFGSRSPQIRRLTDFEGKDPLEFISSISTMTENLNIVLKRSKALTDEYKKIDDNLLKLVNFLSSKNRFLMERYAKSLRESTLKNLAGISRGLHQTDRNCKEKILEMLNQLYESLKNEVNKMKNVTKDRRDTLVTMIKKDRLSVENLQISPKKEFTI